MWVGFQPGFFKVERFILEAPGGGMMKLTMLLSPDKCEKADVEGLSFEDLVDLIPMDKVKLQAAFAAESSLQKFREQVLNSCSSDSSYVLCKLFTNCATTACRDNEWGQSVKWGHIHAASRPSPSPPIRVDSICVKQPLTSPADEFVDVIYFSSIASCARVPKSQ
ncbi:hypothetical protein Cgig2_025213 [Carnegiea gigantea]|uniref:Uncharacterized protein n=1 Tax=Carnegiea gigantea TaxID=171969 RepID=A0A9Q1QNG5_9CARY|nr:hypothetical protein Cgig2_025213 [Carnegiea gigantea]